MDVSSNIQFDKVSFIRKLDLLDRLEWDLSIVLNYESLNLYQIPFVLF